MSRNDLLARSAALPATVMVGARIQVEAGTITAIHCDPAASAEGLPLVLPGFVDLQVNGAGGRGVDEATPEALDAVADAVWRGGAVAFLPTLITAPWDLLLEQVAAVARWLRTFRGQGAEPLGLHLEGPFLDAPGVHDEACFVDPTPARVQALVDAAAGTLRLVTLAHTRPGAPAAVAALRAAGVTVALGHVRGTTGFAECVAAGASMVTHLFNVMGPLHHREPGVAGLALDEERLRCPLIVDGAHVHPAMVRNAFRILGADRTVLVTDAAAAAGMGEGRYRLGGVEVELREGVVRSPTGALAGSALTMGQAAANFARFVPQAGAWTLARVAASNPAQAIGAQGFGSIAPGMRAAFSVREADGTFRALRA